MTRKPDQELEKYLNGGSPLSRAYRAGSGEEPPELLDARIRREARDAARRKPASARPWLTRWAPLAAAAVIVMSISVALFRYESSEPPLPAGGDVALTRSLEKAERITTGPERHAPEHKPVPFPKGRVDTGIRKNMRDAPASPPAAASPAELAPSAPRPGLTTDESVPAGVGILKEDKVSAAPLARARTPAVPAPDSREFRAAGETSRAKRAPAVLAEVAGVTVTGEPGVYRFHITIRSPDKGCGQYANWWEVVSEDGRLLYRRVLPHSHVGEQPFTRDGGPVPVAPDTVVWVRAHMHPGGYGGTAYRGSVRAGFRAALPPAGFAAHLAEAPPLPAGCDF